MANVAATITTAAGYTTLVATKGDLEAASTAAAFESLGTAGLNGGLTGKFIDEGANYLQKTLLSTDLGQSLADALGINTSLTCP
jgi:hypothetical protein